MGQSKTDGRLGQVNLGVEGEPVNGIKRTRVKGTNTLKAIASLPDQEVGLSPHELERAESMQDGKTGENLRAVRDPKEGLLLIYPISRFSGHGEAAPEEGVMRVPIFDDPERGVDVVGLALVFPRSQSAASAEYVTGPVNADVQ